MAKSIKVVKPQFDHNTGKIATAMLKKINALKKAGNNKKMLQAANNIDIPNFNGHYTVSKPRQENEAYVFTIQSKDGVLTCKVLDEKIVLEKIDEKENVLTNTLELPPVAAGSPGGDRSISGAYF